MDKQKVVEQIRQYLDQELAAALQAAKAAYEAATHEESKPEDQYDTRSLEASYLAGAQAKRADEIQQLLTMYKFLPIRPYGADDVICAAALVELDVRGTRAFYFIAPHGGGMVTAVDGKPVQVITPNSPVGDAIIGHRVGDVIEVEVRDSVRVYKVISIA